MDARALFEWLVGQRFSDSESERVVCDWLVHRYAPKLEARLAACQPLDEDVFDLDATPPSDRLPLMTPSTRTALAKLLTTIGFERLPGERNAYALLRPGDSDDALVAHAENTAETIVAIARQMSVLDQVADTANAMVRDYVYAVQPGRPERAAADWVSGPFLAAAEARMAAEPQPGPLLPASVAGEARKVDAKDVTPGQWRHAMIILGRLGYSSKKLRPGAALTELEALEELVPPATEFATRIVLAVLHYLREERRHIKLDQAEHERLEAAKRQGTAGVASAATMTASALELFARFGDCEAVRERKAIEAKEASEQSFEQIHDMSDLVDALVAVIAEGEVHETLEDRRSLHIVTELNAVRRKLADMEAQARTLETSNNELKQLVAASTADTDRARLRVIELERAVAAGPVSPPAGGGPPPPPPPPAGGAPPPPPPPPGGVIPRARIVIKPPPGAAEEGGEKPAAKKQARPLIFDADEMKLRLENMRRRAEAAAQKADRAAMQLESDATTAGANLNDAAAEALANAKERAPILRATQLPPGIAARIQQQRAKRGQASEVPATEGDDETSDERLQRQTRETIAAIQARRKGIAETPGAAPATPGQEWDYPLESLYRMLAPHCFERLVRV